MSFSCDAQSWSQEQFGRCELGDKRRVRRLIKLGAQLSQYAGESPARACRGDSAACEGAYRLLRNDAVTPEAIAQGGFEATVHAARGYRELLAIEDTTSLSYRHEVAEQLGEIGAKGQSKSRGIWAHSVLLLDADSGRSVGLVAQTRWCRQSQSRSYRERAYGHKESFKWQYSSEQLTAQVGDTLIKRIISVCDREADVFEYLSYKIEQHQRYVVRAAHDRRTDDERLCSLSETLAQAPRLGTHTVSVAQRGGRSGRRKRQAKLTLRATEVTLRAPKRAPSLGTLTLNAVLAQETRPPSGADPAVWLLLTSEPIDTLEHVIRVLVHYQRRWRIEEFHKAWKSGAGVELRRMRSPENLQRIAVILAFIAVRLLQLREALQSDIETPSAEIPCTGVLSTDEWQVLWMSHENKPLPKTPPSLLWAYRAIAKLGGFLDTKRTGRAGWNTMWEGWFILQHRLEGYSFAQSKPKM